MPTNEVEFCNYRASERLLELADALKDPSVDVREVIAEALKIQAGLTVSVLQLSRSHIDPPADWEMIADVEN